MDERNEVLARRRKLAALRDAGNTYANNFKQTHSARTLHVQFADASKDKLAEESIFASVAGRIVLRRIMGKASFISLRDETGTIQCYLRKDGVGSINYDDFVELSDLGDIVSVTGTLMRTNKGELTVEAKNYQILAKSLQPFPDKFHGIEDSELKYRRRYVDLIANERSRSVFATRSAVVKEFRRFFDERDFMEVETPMMHPIPGGALARPFTTHHNALDMDLFLRVAPELYLKRLVVGGFERVYEINRNFRNEGLSTRHNPEFTMLEFYQAFATFRDMIALTRELMQHLTTSICGRNDIEYDGQVLDFGCEPRETTMAEAVANEVSLANFKDVYSQSVLGQLARERSVRIPPGSKWGGTLTAMFEQLVEPKLIQPTFVTEYPIEVSPLARRNDENPEVADRFEYFVCGREIANGFSELNDPDDQEERFRSQSESLDRGDEEAMRFDKDFILALQYGMPPTAGEGIGIDRIVMLLTNSTSIRDVLLFPLLKPTSK
ncbi:MAG: lysine--tRNA ligase [Gammaproteobacteria bacterium]|nr:lysine--tRNA ligase [Gammaproteobacteria bacterium]